jgi:PAS domain S-box-containing protein
MTAEPTYKDLKERIRILEEESSKGKQAEEALRESEERFRRISQITHDIVYSCLTNQDGVFLIDWISGNTEEITGYTIDEIKARSCWHYLVIEEDAPLFEKNVIGLPPGQSATIEFRIRHKNGEIIRVTSNAECMADAKTPGCFRLYGGLVDITDRKRTEELLAENEKKYRLMADNIQDVFWMATPEITEMIYVSPAYEKIWGRSCESLYACPQSFIEAIHPEDKKHFASILSESRAQKSSSISIYRIIHPDGSIRWIEDRGFPVYDDQGIHYLNTGVAKDITARKEMEAAIRESEARYRLLAENAMDVIWTVDTNMRLTYVSPSVTRLLGFTVEEAMARTMQQAYTPAAFEKAVQILGEEIAIESSGQGNATRSRIVELELVHKNGSTVPVEGNFCFLREPTGEAIGILSIVRDITERKRMDEDLERHRKHLEDMVKERTAELEIKNTTLQELNVALRVLLKQREDDKKDLEERFVLNIKSLVLPYVEQLKKGQLDIGQKSYLNIIETHLNEITTPLLKNLHQFNLTPKEIKVAALVKQGKSTKEIAEVLGIANGSIDVHRKKIREKLGLRNRKTNLLSRLESIDQ